MENRTEVDRRRRLLLAGAVFAVAVIAPLVPARADTVTPPPVEIPPTETDFTTPISLEPFDPAIGTLQSITITLTAAVTGSMGVENTSTVSGSSGDMELSADVSVAPPGDPGAALAVASPAAVETFDLPVFDGVLDFGGASGFTFAAIDDEQTATVTITDPALLAAASGTASFDLEVSATGTSVANATGGNISTFFLSQAAAVITVTYDYDPVPVGIAVQKETNGADADDPFGDDVPRVAPGGAVTWTYTVTNTGGVAVEDVVVLDDQIGEVAGPLSGDTDGDGLLAVDEVWVYEASGSAEDVGDTSAATVPGCPDPDGTPRLAYRNIVTVSGTAGGEPVTAEDLSHYCNPRAGIAIEKATNGMDADDPSGADVPRVAPGDAVSWSYVVTNLGELPVSDVLVVDDQLGVVPGPVSGDVDSDGLLDVDEEWRYELIGVADDLIETTATTVLGCPDQQGDLHPVYVNVGTVSGRIGAMEVADADASHYCNPAEAAVVLILGDNEVELGPLEAGDQFVYRADAHNLGSAAVTDLTLEISIPPEVELVSVAGAGCATAAGSASTVRCVGIDLGPGAVFPAEVTAVVASDVSCVALASAEISMAGEALSHDGEPTSIVGSADLVAPAFSPPAPDEALVLATSLGGDVTADAALAATGSNLGRVWMLALVGIALGVAVLLGSGMMHRRGVRREPRRGE